MFIFVVASSPPQFMKMVNKELHTFFDAYLPFGFLTMQR